MTMPNTMSLIKVLSIEKGLLTIMCPTLDYRKLGQLLATSRSIKNITKEYMEDEFQKFLNQIKINDRIYSFENQQKIIPDLLGKTKESTNNDGEKTKYQYFLKRYLERCPSDDLDRCSEIIAGVILNISRSDEGRLALIANGAIVITTLNRLATQTNTVLGRRYIAGAIFNIATRAAGIRALIEKGAITTLMHLATQDNTIHGRECIAGAILDIARSDAGRQALIEKGAITTLNRLATQDNTIHGRRYIREAKPLLIPNSDCTVS